jgi:archaellum component FlaG (FlaF/FlaG flagellin family)
MGSPVLRFSSSIIRLIAIAASVLVLAGLVGFLTDEVRSSSKVSETRLTTVQGGQPQTVSVDIGEPDPPAAVERVREKEHTDAREVIDDANDILFAPFSWIGDDRAPWVQRLICAGLALLIYGFVLMILADRIRRLGDQMRREAISAAEQKAAEERRASGTYASPA